MRLVTAIMLALISLSAWADPRAESDAEAVRLYRYGLRHAAEQVRGIGGAERAMLTAAEKEQVREAWSSFLDYLLALDSIGAYHREARGERALVVSYSAFLAQYRGALEMIAAADALPGADAVLNEPVPSIGVPAGTYAKIKLRWLNVSRATEFAALESLFRLTRGSSFPDLRTSIDEDSAAVLRAGRLKGPLQTAKNALKIAQSTAFTAWFPVQKGVAEWMGDTKVARVEQFLITPKQIAQLAPKLEPGDVLLERREWYVSNVGLPGYWPHAALYIGDAEARRRYFADAGVQAWVREQGRADGDFEALLAQQKSYARSPKHEVIEAVSEGVSFTTLDHSAAADSLAVIRPRATKREKAIALARAFGYIGRPYDFNFDFHTDTSLVCSEVVYKAYEPAVALPVVKVMGRMATPPNEIVREFDRTYGTDAQQFDLVLFLDGHERRGAALPATVETFRRSWDRPKWHIALQ